ncbi:hypothetical protein AB0K51_07655 [Kitasatospora sp. NPDC049285]|uniref:hypothetical protein n=1 Tax=Kitasatospora sp. NPDC049285 TaxID=3157096 RepID=UPI003431E50F
MLPEEDFARALRASADLAPEPAVELFALAAERRGRTRVRRRRTAAASAVGVVAAAALALAVLPDRPAPRPAPAAPPVSAQFMTVTLRSLLPADGLVTDVNGQTADDQLPGGHPLAWLDYDDGRGPVTVLLTVNRVAVPLTDGSTGVQCPDSLSEPTTSCRRETRPDGSRVLTLVKQPRWTGDDRSWTVVHTAPDGRQVRVDETTPARALREQPALTEAQLLDVVSSDAWRPAFVGMPAVSAQPAAAPPAAVLATLRGALPAGASFDAGTGVQDTPGRVHGAVTAAGRTSQLVVSVEHGWHRGFPDDPRTAFEQLGYGSTLAVTGDGTRTAVGERTVLGPDGATGRSWHAAALLPDGTLVSAQLWTYGPGFTYSAEPGALTSAQLLAVVTAPAWSHA